MKVVNIFRGGVAVRLPMDGYTPDIEPPIQIFIQLIAARYQFAGWPMNQPLAPANNTFKFENGIYVVDGVNARLHSLYIEPVGAYLESANTIVAEKAVNDLADFLDQSLGYKLRQVQAKFSYTSVIVAKFNKSIDLMFMHTELIRNLISGGRPEKNPPSVKKIDFNFGELPIIAPVTQVDNAETTTFSIERRVGFQSEENVYFCIAPMRTEEHIAALEKIEEIL